MQLLERGYSEMLGKAAARCRKWSDRTELLQEVLAARQRRLNCSLNVSDKDYMINIFRMRVKYNPLVRQLNLNRIIGRKWKALQPVLQYAAARRAGLLPQDPICQQLLSATCEEDVQENQGKQTHFQISYAADKTLGKLLSQ